MLKKKFAAMIAAALMTMSASSAFATFADLELIRVYYDRSGAEIATDLGSVKNLTAAGAVTNIAGSFGGLTQGYAVYFALDRATAQLWSTGNATTAQVITGGSTGITSLKSGTNYVYSLYNTQGGTNYSGLASNLNSYKNKMSATQGNMAGAINNNYRLNTEASLSSLLPGTGSVAQTLYFWNNALTAVTEEKVGVAAATIFTNADGSTTITSSAATAPTPIPPAFLLMGSGLLGMVGLRRKARKA